MPEQTTEQHSHAKLFLWLGLLVVFLVAVSIVAVMIGSPWRGEVPVTSETIRLGEAPRPAFTTAVEEKVRASSGFNALVSYTGASFEPVSVTIAAGQVVRFTNNSSMALELQTDGARVTLAPQDFYEHTYAVPGTYAYQSAGASGVVQVR